MLSAVAARKAALATAAPSVPPSQPSPEDVTPNKTHSSPTKPAARKRKSVDTESAREIPSTSTSKPKFTTKRARRHESVPSIPATLQGGRSLHPPNVEGIDAVSTAIDSDNSERMLSSPPDSDIEVEPQLFSSTSTSNARAWSPSRPLQDSSDEEEVAIPTTRDKPLQQAASPSTTFRAIFGQNCSPLPENMPGVAIVLHCDEVLTLVGTYTVTVVKGLVSIAGTPVSPSSLSHNVFAPRCSPIPEIKALECQQTSSSASRWLPSAISDNLQPNDSVVLIRPLSTGIETLGSIVKTFTGVFRLAGRQLSQTEEFATVPGISQLTEQTPDVEPLFIPRTWQTAMDAIQHAVPANDMDIADSPIYLVRGPKRVGKSTFARLLLNQLLTRYRHVAFLECDLGQSEFTPAGMVALNVLSRPVFGPSFTHPTIPHTAHYIGSVTPRDAPTQYLAAIEACMQTYHLDIASGAGPSFQEDEDLFNKRVLDVIPLVVNTMGWTKGLGADLNAQLSSLVVPTTVFSFDTPTVPGAYTEAPGSYAPEAGTEAATHVIEPILSQFLAARYTASEYRNLNIISYLHCVFPTQPAGGGTIRNIMANTWTPIPLRRRVPYIVDWSTAFDALRLVAPGGEDVIGAEVGRVMNGSLVALVDCEPGALNDVGISGGSNVGTSDAAPEWRYIRAAAPPLPETSRCVGLALIRGVSTVVPGENVTAHVLTPLPPAALENCRVVVKGALGLPIWGMLDGDDSREAPYLRWAPAGGQEVLGGERRRVRRNLMRKGQM